MTSAGRLLEGRYGRPADAAEEVSETISGFLSRRCIRRYVDRPVPPALLETLLACAQSAPSKSDLQQYSIVVTEEREGLSRLAQLCPGNGHVRYCPAFVTFCADNRRMRRIAEMRGYSFAGDGMDGFFNAVVDAAVAMQCFIAAAEAAGLGCAPTSEVRDRIAEFSAALSLPRGVFPVAGVTLGWPAWEGRISARLPPEVVVHRERYDDACLEEAVDAYDARRHEAGPIPPERQNRVDRYGVSERCAWSENAARQLSVEERPGFRDFLVGHGFAIDRTL